MQAEIKKPELSPAVKMRAKKLEEMLKQRVWTKEELELYFYPNSPVGRHNRQIRILVERLKEQGLPIKSTSDSRGYCLLWDYAKHTEVAGHCWNEAKKKARKIISNAMPAKKFYEEGKRRGY